MELLSSMHITLHFLIFEEERNYLSETIVLAIEFFLMNDIYKANIRNIVFTGPKGAVGWLPSFNQNLNSEKEITIFKISGSEFNIIGPKYLTEL